jgi:hypothetical protein
MTALPQDITRRVPCQQNLLLSGERKILSDLPPLSTSLAFLPDFADTVPARGPEM